MHYQKILHFWFNELTAADWWKKDSNLDRRIQDRFATWHAAALKGELVSWRHEIQGRLAEIIILDQFSRNIYRDQAQSFAQDPMALALAQEAITLGYHRRLNVTQRSFLYLPFMHSESALIHETALKLYRDKGMEFNFDFEKKHKAIIDRFGRYPHRNIILGRTSTAAEIEFLQEPGSSF